MNSGHGKHGLGPSSRRERLRKFVEEHFSHRVKLPEGDGRLSNGGVDDYKGMVLVRDQRFSKVISFGVYQPLQ